MKSKYQHTFVIMGYQESEYLEDCYQALMKQTVKSNIIITSSTPNDFQKDFAERHHIPFIINPNRIGFAQDLNFAYAQADTDYVTMVHQDDLLLPQYAESCIDAANKYTDSLIVFTDYAEYIDGKLKRDSLNIKVKNLILKSNYFFKNNLKSRFFKRSLLSFGNPISCPSIFYVKKNIGEMKFLDEYKVSPEWELLIRLAKMKGRFIYVNKLLHAYRMHGGQITSVGLADRKKEDELVFNQLWAKPIAKALTKLYSRAYAKVPPAEK